MRDKKKKKILILDAFTYGHEAAMELIKKMELREQDCEIIFCGTHEMIFNRFIEGQSFAVVPVQNSIAGEISENTQRLKELREMGYNIKEVCRLDLKINHSLLVQQSVVSQANVGSVVSHEKAIAQCGKFLDSIGIPASKRDTRNSTGNAAKYVSRLSSPSNVAAIAPRAAAKAYGLKVLAENIQDRLDNKTTFVLLENKAIIQSVVVGIIGSEGKFGKFLTNFFRGIGCRVIGWDKSMTGQNLGAYVVKRSDVVVFAVPIQETPQIISGLAIHARRDQLLLDVTSVKKPAIDAMLKSKAQVVGLHPMFAPDVSFEGQTIVVCPARLTDPAMKTWLVNVLSATKADIKWSTPETHDLYMEVVQATPHLANLASALLIAEMDVSVQESLTYTSPFYRIVFSLMGRLLSQDPNLYASIAIENPATVDMLQRRIAIETELLDVIKRKDYPGFCRLFAKAAEHFGKKVTSGANELFIRQISVLKTNYGKNSLILEFSTDRTGLLKKITDVFYKWNINLTGINSVKFGGDRLQFTISFDGSNSSDNVRKALEEMETWKDSKVSITRN